MPVNPFSEVQDLLNRAHKRGAHFGHGEKRHKELCIYENNMPSGLASVCIKLDLNKDLISARHSLVHSILRIHKGLACYFVRKEGDWTHTSEDFKNIAEIEGVL